jgi:endonuclease/exonuclease/phosphatase family metal-dependent hydrolase
VGHDGAVATRILTWNVQGRERPDLEAVAAVIADARPDVVALQEVQRGQARALARRLGWSFVWRFKHWSVVVPPEGLALLAPVPPTDVATVHLVHPFRFWSWRRRIAVRAMVAAGGEPFAVVATHLGAGVGDQERSRQAELAIGALDVGEGPVRPNCVVGDLNARPGSPVLARFAEHGLRDAWDVVRPGEPGPTNWRSGRRDGPPTQRLDYVLVDDGFDVVSAELPEAGEPGFERYADLSDHLPLSVTLTPTGDGGSRR